MYMYMHVPSILTSKLINIMGMNMRKMSQSTRARASNSISSCSPSSGFKPPGSWRKRLSYSNSPTVMVAVLKRALRGVEKEAL